ncbi:MAG: hypothetical protein K2H64_01390 [Desulfovibrio sp.]|nr:hypothetical protein [Desulfovibrio sp.]
MEKNFWSDGEIMEATFSGTFPVAPDELGVADAIRDLDLRLSELERALNLAPRSYETDSGDARDTL